MTTISYLNDISKEIHEIACEKGFYNHALISPYDVKNPSIVPEKLCLICTEVSECLEAFRDNDCEEMAVELADIIIRTLDLCAFLEVDIEETLKAKIEKNRDRPFLHGRTR